MPTIGKIAIALEAQYQNYTAGLQHAAQQTAALQAQIEQTHAGGGGFLQSLTTGVGVGAGIAAATEAFHLLAEGARLAVESVEKWVATAIEAGDQAWKLASALHVPTESLTGLAAVAKVKAGQSLEDFATTIEKLNKQMGEAATAGGPTAAAFERLGLSAQSLAEEGIDQSFLRVAQSLHDVKNPAEQAALTVELFGKSGQKLLPMFLEGREGIEAAMKSARQMGVALNDFDAAKLHAVKEAGDQIELSFEGIKNQFALALAPSLIEISHHVMALVPTADQMRQGFATAIDWIATAIARLWDGFEIGKAVVLGVASVAVAQAESMLIAIDEIAKGFRNLMSTLEDVRKAIAPISGALVTAASGVASLTGQGVQAWWGNLSQASTNASDTAVGEASRRLDKIRLSLMEDAGKAWAAPSHLKPVHDFFDTILKRANETAKTLADHKGMADALPRILSDDAKKKVEDGIGEITKSIQTLWMTSEQKTLFGLAENGAGVEQLERATAYLKVLQEQTDQLKRQTEYQQMAKDNASPLDKYAEEIAKIKTAMAENFLTPELAANGISKANKDLVSAAGGLTAGKTAAETRRFDFDMGKQATRIDPIAELAQLAKANNKAVETSKEYLRSIDQFNRDQQANQLEVVNF